MPAAAKRERPKVEPITFDSVVLVGGPLDGQRLRIQRGNTLSIPTRAKRGRADRPPCAVYRGDSASGRLTYAGTVGERHECAS